MSRPRQALPDGILVPQGERYPRRAVQQNPSTLSSHPTGTAGQCGRKTGSSEMDTSSNTCDVSVSVRSKRSRST